MTNTDMLINSLDRAMMESLKVFRQGSVGSEQNFVVVNHENQDAYEVVVDNGIIQKCTCPHSTHRKAVCKHMLKVSMKMKMDIEQLKRVEF
ncbi:SWIM zinc finger family protein [Viridibacillus arvi]|uniref:SWIM zinc finger family protein n=1 Tax=Viridibacillus arvi TaxID=263475 RepID=UPI0034D0078F